MTAGRRVNTKSIHWCTPPKYVTPITEFMGNIELDPCSNEDSIVNADINLYENGLSYDWNKHSTIYVNPPYGRGIYNWLEKCNETNIKSGAEIISLIPVATNTKHWKEFVFNSDCICFLYDTRLKFLMNGNTNNKGASMACCLIYWGSRRNEFVKKFNTYGQCCITIS